MDLPTTNGTLIIQWGSVAISGANVAIAFSQAFPTSCDSVACMPTNLYASEGFYVSSVTTSGFVCNFGGSITGTLYWIAYGH
jgi:hypothetical protein